MSAALQIYTADRPKQTQFLQNIQFNLKIGMTGFEPATPSSRTRCATKLRYIPNLVNISLGYHIQIKIEQARIL